MFNVSNISTSYKYISQDNDERNVGKYTHDKTLDILRLENMEFLIKTFVP